MGQSVFSWSSMEAGWILLCRYLFLYISSAISFLLSGIVTPVVHYCMGGITINENGQVLNKMGAVIKGLLAAGEIIGGLHGKNRLGGILI